MQTDTHLVGDDYTWVATALYFGWLGKPWLSAARIKAYN
jgi:hypothetical protein